MCITIKPGLMVRIKQFGGPRPPMPLPLESGFSATNLYEIVGLHVPSESGEAYCVLVNDLGQLWFISNRHLQVCPENSGLKTGVNQPPNRSTPILEDAPD